MCPVDPGVFGKKRNSCNVVIESRLKDGSVWLSAQKLWE